MKTFEQLQIDHWASLCEGAKINESLDPADEREINEMIKYCNKQYIKYNTNEARFKEFSFEGQMLRNVWDMLGTTCDLIKDEAPLKQVLDYLGRAMIQLSDADGHKRPIPTDPRDIK